MLVRLSMAFLVLLTMTATPLLAAGEKGSISGRVVDESGAPVPNAIIRILGRLMSRQAPTGGPAAPKPESAFGVEDGAIQFQSTKGKRVVSSGKTDADGKFTLKGVEAGDFEYQVMVSGTVKATGAVHVDANKDQALGDVKLSK